MISNGYVGMKKSEEMQAIEALAEALGMKMKRELLWHSHDYLGCGVYSENAPPKATIPTCKYTFVRKSEGEVVQDEV